MRKGFLKVMDVIDGFERILLNCLLGAILLIITAEVILRNFFSLSLSWSNEVAGYLSVFLVFISVSQVTKTNTHLRLSIIDHPLFKSVKNIVGVIAIIISMMFVLYLCYAGVSQVTEVYHAGIRSTSLLAFPQWIVFLSVPLGAFLMFLRYIESVLRNGERR